MAQYHGGLSWAPDPAEGELSLDDDRIEVIKIVSTVLKKYKETVVTIQVKAIEYVEVTSEQVARSRFLTFGGILSKGAVDRGTLIVHLKSGQAGYFSINDYSQHEILGKITPWLRSTQIRVGTPSSKTPTPASSNPISVADEIAKLGALKAQGLLSEEEFAAQKAKLLA